jgi:hypothetical protein
MEGVETCSKSCIKGIERKLSEILELLIASNQIATPVVTKTLAQEIASGNRAALRAHNKQQSLNHRKAFGRL